jgi:hypothetical protein
MLNVVMVSVIILSVVAHYVEERNVKCVNYLEYEQFILLMSLKLMRLLLMMESILKKEIPEVYFFRKNLFDKPGNQAF